MPLLRIFGIVTLSCLIVGGVVLFSGGRPIVFVDLGAVAFIIVGVCGVLMVGCKGGDWGHALSIAFRNANSLSADKKQSALRFFKLARRSAIGIGFIAFLFNLIGTTYDYSSIAPFFALSLIGPLYGLILAELVFTPLITIAQQLDDKGDDPT